MPARALFLTGLPGAGKTTVGRALASSLQWPFLDLDVAISDRTQHTISQLFAQHGEPAFRALERATLCDLLDAQETQGAPFVLALGGGAWVQEGAEALLRPRGVTVFLDAPERVLWERLQGDPEPRPLLREGERALAALAARRRSAYARADLRVDACGEPAQVAARILAGLSEGLAPDFAAVQVELGARAYPIWLGGGGIAQSAALARLHLEALHPKPSQVFVVSDERVAALYGEAFLAGLAGGPWSACLTSIPPGERSKSLDVLARVWDELLGRSPGRDDVVIALGGGVVGDLAGFVAATLLRGLRFVQIPTTLMAQLDSAVGGKTGINHPRGKNLLGAFHQPTAVIAGLRVLETLDPRERRSGLAELVKYALLEGEPVLSELERDAEQLARAPWALPAWIARGCAVKARIVALDEHEQGPRAWLNLGHTFGHAIEAMEGFGGVTHGEAVALGCILAARASAHLGLGGQGVEARLAAILERLGLPTDPSSWLARPAQMARLMGSDKKRQGAVVRLVLLRAPGEIVLHPVAVEALEELLMALALRREQA